MGRRIHWFRALGLQSDPARGFCEYRQEQVLHLKDDAPMVIEQLVSSEQGKNVTRGREILKEEADAELLVTGCSPP